MKKIIAKLILLLLSVVIFMILWKLMQYIFNAFVPFNPMTELIAFVVIVIMIPTSMVLADISFMLFQKSFK
ncbi:hypothetical protein [Psychrobacillus soli]|uniref:Uncharacterized protein n=1 Tax=Psychrobacillus soli TaxID=1543965 RepID=A0A544TDW9_9BACI|nr:hypothetical protein [Psychrobacillus soli]TQR15658.1 hypothetical protein FG383_08730 [Psychrobacillus soli]